MANNMKSKLIVPKSGERNVHRMAQIENDLHKKEIRETMSKIKTESEEASQDQPKEKKTRKARTTKSVLTVAAASTTDLQAEIDKRRLASMSKDDFTKWWENAESTVGDDAKNLFADMKQLAAKGLAHLKGE